MAKNEMRKISIKEIGFRRHRGGKKKEKEKYRRRSNPPGGFVNFCDLACSKYGNRTLDALQIFVQSPKSWIRMHLEGDVSPSLHGFRDKLRSAFQTRSATNMVTNNEVSSKVPASEVDHVDMLNASYDAYEGVIVNIKEDMDENVFTTLLQTSISQWRQQGKKGVWLFLPIEHVNLVKPAVEEGFWYHHAEPTYLMLVYWIPETIPTLPPNASHRVGVAAFVLNAKGEVLVVHEKNGGFKGTGVWKLPTGVVEEGEDICAAAIREVKEEAGIDAEFVEVLAFRQSHKSFFSKSDLMFVCMLKPTSFDIEKQDSEIEAAQWMTVEEYANQPFVKKHKSFDYIAEICIAKKDNKYVGFSALPTATATSSKKSYLYSHYQEQ